METWNNALNEILRLVSQSPEGFRGGSIWTVVVSVNGALKAAAFALLVLFFCMGIFKTASNVSELKRPEAAVKMFIRFALAKAAISYCMEILVALLSICQGILSTVSSQLGSLENASATLPVEVSTKIAEVGFLDSVPLWIVTLLGSIFITVLSFVMLMTIYGRFFRVFMYTAIAPIALSTFAGEGTSHFGKAFLKSYAGVCMEGVIVMLACVIFNAYVGEPPQGMNDSLSAVQIVWDYVLELIFSLLVLVGSIKMTERLSKEMLGL